MVYSQPNTWPGEWDIESPMGFWYIYGSSNLGQTTRPYNNQQKKRTCKIMIFTDLADNRVKLK